MLNINKSVMVLLIVAMFVTITFVYAVKQPEGTSQQAIVSSSRRLPASASATRIEAGNVTKLNITGTTVTQAWAGFYGYITGTVTLDDANGDTLYDWALLAPRGQVYAIMQNFGTPNWTYRNIECWNFSEGATGGVEAYADYNTVKEVETFLTIRHDDIDSINATFAPHPWTGSIYVGQTPINTSKTGIDLQQCKKVNLYVNNASQSENFTEILLYDRNGTLRADGAAADGFPIYTAILERYDPIGFDGGQYDFQMIVNADNHEGNVAMTPYVFYLEIE
jgi:hypothetical protein